MEKTYTDGEILLVEKSLEDMKVSIPEIELKDMDQENVNELFFLLNFLGNELSDGMNTEFIPTVEIPLEDLNEKELDRLCNLLIYISESLLKIAKSRRV